MQIKTKKYFLKNGFFDVPQHLQIEITDECPLKCPQCYKTDKEYKYIEAGVSGLEKRSQTGKTERGNGLPSIYEQYRNNKVDRLVIISNKAYFETENSRDLKNELHGTIFYWKIKKEERT